MKHLISLAFLVAGIAAFSPAADAQQVAYTSAAANLRAGPARDYPLVAVVPPGYPITVMGCLSNYRWCDVVAGPSRGWLWSGHISYPYGNTYVPLMDYGPSVGIVILSFVLGDYWGEHYRHRPWYSERERWSHHHPPGAGPGFVRPAPRPAPGVRHNAAPFRAPQPAPDRTRTQPQPGTHVVPRSAPIQGTPPRQQQPRLNREDGQRSATTTERRRTEDRQRDRKDKRDGDH